MALNVGEKVRIKRRYIDWTIEGIVLAEENREKYRIYHVMVKKSRAEEYAPN